jgi:hypothetical protein
MSFVDLIGFLISLLAIAFLFFKNWRDATSQSELPIDKEGMGEEDIELKEFLKSSELQKKQFNQPSPNRHPPSSTSFQPAKNFPKNPSKKGAPRLESKLESYHLTSQLEHYHLSSQLERRQVRTELTERYEAHAMGTKPIPRVSQIVRELPHLRNMMIYHEILNPPKSLRKL